MHYLAIMIGATKNRTNRTSTTYNFTDCTSVAWCKTIASTARVQQKIAPTTSVQCVQLQAQWCDGRRTVAELVYMDL